MPLLASRRAKPYSLGAMKWAFGRAVLLCFILLFAPNCLVNGHPDLGSISNVLAQACHIRFEASWPVYVSEKNFLYFELLKHFAPTCLTSWIDVKHVCPMFLPCWTILPKLVEFDVAAHLPCAHLKPWQLWTQNEFQVTSLVDTCWVYPQVPTASFLTTCRIDWVCP